MQHLRRFCSLRSTDRPRILCSLNELKTGGQGKTIKFVLNTTEKPVQCTKSNRRNSTVTGFVFYCNETQQPRAFKNLCPHALLELDWDDNDFFSDQFIQCKAHGAFFDPRTGICLQGPVSKRPQKSNERLRNGLSSLPVKVDNEGNVVLLDDSFIKVDQEQQDLAEYKTQRQRDLAIALTRRIETVKQIQQSLDEKTQQRLRRYAEKKQSVVISTKLKPLTDSE